MMRIQFVNVPTGDNYGATPGKVLMCISEVREVEKCGEIAQVLKSNLGVAGLLITDEVVHFDPATDSYLEDGPESEAVHPCGVCLARPGGKWVASSSCDHA